MLRHICASIALITAFAIPAAQAEPIKNVDVVKKVFPTEAAWEALFPIAYSNPSCNGKEALTRDALITAVAAFPAFLSSDDLTKNVRELAAFLANVSQETTGASCTEPADPETLLDYDIPLKCSQPLGGTCYVREVGGHGQDYCSVVSQNWYDERKSEPYYGDIEKNCKTNNYFGRGALQITNPANYASTSKALLQNEANFLKTPDLLVTGGYAWKASLDFWVNNKGGLTGDSVTTVKSNITAHDAIVNYDDFGKTIEVINGNIECGEVSEAAAFKVRNRVRYYQTYLDIFGKAAGVEVAPGYLNCITKIQAKTPNRCGNSWKQAATECVAKVNCTSDSDCPVMPNSGGKHYSCFADINPDPCAAK